VTAPDVDLREALARWLRSRYPVTPNEAQREADALLSGPLASLLTKLRAVEALRQALAGLTEAVARGDEHGLAEAYRAARGALDAS